MMLSSFDIEDAVVCRMLLWHGSRLTNWAGILGQGLRIAPPEAPVTGYMVSKLTVWLLHNWLKHNSHILKKK